jgi:septal ring factor EnvC (AmiA/AmiB activator)
MDILGRDNWRNATTTSGYIESIKSEISNIEKQIITHQRVADSPFESLLRKKEAQDIVLRLKTQLSKLNNDLNEAIKTQQTVDTFTKDEMDIVAAEASVKKAKSIGIWIGVGLLAIAGGALIYFKIIKKRK